MDSELGSLRFLTLDAMSGDRRPSPACDSVIQARRISTCSIIDRSNRGAMSLCEWITLTTKSTFATLSHIGLTRWLTLSQMPCAKVSIYCECVKIMNFNYSGGEYLFPRESWSKDRLSLDPPPGVSVGPSFGFAMAFKVSYRAYAPRAIDTLVTNPPSSEATRE